MLPGSNSAFTVTCAILLRLTVLRSVQSSSGGFEERSRGQLSKLMLTRPSPCICSSTSRAEPLRGLRDASRRTSPLPCSPATSEMCKSPLILAGVLVLSWSLHSFAIDTLTSISSPSFTYDVGLHSHSSSPLSSQTETSGNSEAAATHPFSKRLAVCGCATASLSSRPSAAAGVMSGPT